MEVPEGSRQNKIQTPQTGQEFYFANQRCKANVIHLWVANITMTPTTTALFIYLFICIVLYSFCIINNEIINNYYYTISSI